MYSCPRREFGRSVHHSLRLSTQLKLRRSRRAFYRRPPWALNVHTYILGRQRDRPSHHALHHTAQSRYIPGVHRQSNNETRIGEGGPHNTHSDVDFPRRIRNFSRKPLSPSKHLISLISSRTPGNIRPILRRPPPFAAYIQQSSRPAKPTPYIQHAPRSSRRPQAPNPSPFHTLCLFYFLLLIFRNAEGGYNLGIHGIDGQPQREHVPSALPAVL